MALESDQERVEAELALLVAMYPDEVTFDSKSKEIAFFPPEAGAKARLCIRLLDDYPSNSRPVVVTASVSDHDVRDRVKASIAGLPKGEEALDAVLTAFRDLVTSFCNDPAETGMCAKDEALPEGQAIVIIWLHHLLSTIKRKAILAPPGECVSGISKPGHPGVLIFTGPSRYVQEHVHALRGINWQAFQVRAELDELWQLKHGNGVIEVETIAEIVQELGGNEEKKRLFLEAMKIK